MNRLLVFIASVGVAFVMITFTASANASVVMAAVHASRPHHVCGGDSGGGSIVSWEIRPSESLSGPGLETL